MTAKPETKQGKGLSAVWIIPIVAAVLGAWLVVYNYINEGPDVEITFNSATGLEEGKTTVKFLDVEIGMLQEVRIDEDLEGITAVVKLRKEYESLLNEDTRFWVVRARVGGGAVTGLDTILSGAYITLSPGKSAARSKRFVGLEEPPLTPADAPGIRLVLRSDQSSSLTTGDPVLYHGFKVGRVESLTFDPETRRFRNEIFIDAPYHSLITTSTRFWDVSGFSLHAGADGLKLETGSFESMLLGGVTFGDPPQLEPGGPVTNNTEFRLFKNYDEILESPHEHRDYYVVGFEQSVKGLLPGAPVEYRGITIGEVERIMMEEVVDTTLRGGNYEPQGVPIPVLIYIEPARFALPDTEASLTQMRETFSRGIENGLRATLGQGNLLTGAKLVELEYYADQPAAEAGEFAGHPTIPTIVTGLSGLEQKISALLDKANDLPIDEIAGSLNLAMAELNRSMKAVRTLMEKDSVNQIPDELEGALVALRALLEAEETQSIPVELEASIEALRAILEDEGIRRIPGELNSALAAAKFQLQGESAEIYQLNRTLKEVESAARALREFLDTVEKKPESLIRGKSDSE